MSVSARRRVRIARHGVVHVVQRWQWDMRPQFLSGRLINEAYGHTLCDFGFKLNTTSRNKLTDDYATCMTCLCVEVARDSWWWESTAWWREQAG